MTGSIFDLFNSETVEIKNTDRSKLTPSTGFDVTLDAIVKRRNAMALTSTSSEDRYYSTSLHFHPEDAQYVQVGNYVNIDDEWHTIKLVRNGKDFTDNIEFIYAEVDNDVVEFVSGGWHD